MQALPVVPLPKGWTERAKSGALHAIALARFALMHVRGWCADSRIARARLAAERDAAVAAAAQAKEEARILRSKLESIPAKKRPHYAPEERLAILMLRAATGWTAAETARRFLVSDETIASWMKRIDEEGADALLKMPVPINRFPVYLAEVVRRLRALQPSLGKVRIADVLTRAGLHLSPSTVGRMLEREPARPEPTTDASGSDAAEAGEAKTSVGETKTIRRVTAKHPHHLWHVDITLLPRIGWWVPWAPQSLVQRAPFCAWLVVVLDHFSRSVVGCEVFDKEPTADEVCRVLDQARRRMKATPKHIVSDQGVQFRDEYKAWCEQRGVRPRFGAIGEHGSIAVIERFFRSLKTEMLRKLPWVPMNKKKLAAEVAAYVGWYGPHRPHRRARRSDAARGEDRREARAGTAPARAASWLSAPQDGEASERKASEGETRTRGRPLRGPTPSAHRVASRSGVTP